MCKRQQIINRLIDLISEVEEYNKTGIDQWPEELLIDLCKAAGKVAKHVKPLREAVLEVALEIGMKKLQNCCSHCGQEGPENPNLPCANCGQSDICFP